MLTQKERDRLKVLHEVKQGHLTQAAGAAQLGVSERWVRELIGRMRRKGDQAVIHGLRGRRSKRRIQAKIRQRAVDLYRQEYGDFGPTLAAEYLQERHRIQVSKETLRKWLIEAAAWQAKPRKAKQVHVWRPRRRCRGELVQWDTSIHDWLEGRSRRPVKLIAMIDDASNELFARFVEEDSTAEHMRVLRDYLQQNGRPQAFYTDKAGLFRVNLPRKRASGARPEESETQIGRALRELGIELIHAHSPQAKGRVERCFGTLQDRLVKGLRKAGAESIEQANRYLAQVFLPTWSQRFRRPAASTVDAHRPLGEQLDGILSHVETRLVDNDFTVSWDGKRYQIPRDAIIAGLRRSMVRMEARLDGTVWVRVGEKAVPVERCPDPLAELELRQSAPRRKDHNRGGRSEWMKNFDLQKGRPVWQPERVAKNL
ncbi:MAG TPA: ISNCY family transposase [Candidatus Acidoferrum sp.]